MPATEFLTHPLPPIYDQFSQTLILGPFPSRQSRALGYNYAHPQNRFWPILAAVFQTEITDQNRRQFLLDHRLGLWDVIASCQITGSSDASISQVTVNDVPSLLRQSQIKQILTTGQTAFKLYQKYLYPRTGLIAQLLPSPSPANAKSSLADLIAIYQPFLTKSFPQTS